MKNKPYTLLVGVDFSELADRALYEAFAQASQRPNSEVHVLSVLPVTGTDPGYAVSVYSTLDEKPILDKAIQRLRAHVDEQLEKFRLAHPEAQLNFRVISHAHVDTASHGIVQLAADLAADLIVIGTHNRKGVERFLLGSVAEATVRGARCPVLVIPAPEKADAASTVEPPCPECVKARAASAGKEFWCEQHRERHGRRHTYHQSDRSSRDSNFPLVFR
ncbi:MAG TPA: universal stress protein [Polyangiaceae bacterium]|jgi:nucleotide-binding universal stress UspA family protein|nr:universal stress protein [Polyangiaceae bacterium]